VLASAAALLSAGSLSGCVVTFDDESFIQFLTCLAGDTAACDRASGDYEDRDRDGVRDDLDNCSRANPTQLDSDRDGLGDRCERNPPPPEPTESPPGTPTGLAATGNTNGTISLNWNDNPASDGVDHYRVMRSERRGQSYAIVARPTASSYTDGGVQPNRIYYYVVQAVDDDDLSAFSNEASAASCSPPFEFPNGCPERATRVSAAAAARSAFTVRFTTFRSGFSAARAPGGNYVGRRGFAGGTFTSRFRGRRAGALPARASGNWRSSFTLRADPAKHVATVRGVALLDFPAPRAGRLCLAYSTRSTIVRGRLRTRGTLRALGATRAQRRLLGRGSFGVTRAAGGQWTLRGKARPRRGKARGLPSRCRAVARHP
jgi:hypothetical protein